jgi:hypothetical protein
LAQARRPQPPHVGVTENQFGTPRNMEESSAGGGIGGCTNAGNGIALNTGIEGTNRAGVRVQRKKGSFSPGRQTVKLVALVFGSVVKEKSATYLSTIFCYEQQTNICLRYETH